MKIPMKYIIELGLIRKRNNCAKCNKTMDIKKIELGLIRKRNNCAKCNKTMDIKNYHIQLCSKCRKEEFAIIKIEEFS